VILLEGGCDMLAIGLSLAACLGWGVADYLGGIKSRQLPGKYTQQVERRIK